MFGLRTVRLQSSRAFVRARRGLCSTKPIPTALYDAHVKLGGSMVDFAGSTGEREREREERKREREREIARLTDIVLGS